MRCERNGKESIGWLRIIHNLNTSSTAFYVSAVNDVDDVKMTAFMNVAMKTCCGKPYYSMSQLFALLACLSAQPLT